VVDVDEPVVGLSGDARPLTYTLKPSSILTCTPDAVT